MSFAATSYLIINNIVAAQRSPVKRDRQHKVDNSTNDQHPFVEGQFVEERLRLSLEVPASVHKLLRLRTLYGVQVIATRFTRPHNDNKTVSRPPSGFRNENPI